eukprot:symbB.v1.2.023418.t1/scaffold2140.1/size107487/6
MSGTLIMMICGGFLSQGSNLAGRIARLLERVGILWPLLVRTVAREQKIARGEAMSLPKVTAPEGDYAWDLQDTEENLVLGMWGHGGKLATCLISAKQLCRLCSFPPRPNDWFCAACLAHNVSKANRCRKCGDQSFAGVVAQSWRASNGKGQDRPAIRREGHQSGLSGALMRVRHRLASWLPWRFAVVAILTLFFAQFLRRRSRALKF